MKKSVLLALTLPMLGLSSVVYADFQSPSGNIVCSTSASLNPEGGVTCFIGDMTNSKPALPRRKDCDFDWGQMFAVDKTGKAYMLCYSDYPFDPNPTILHYGQTLKGKTYQCTSQATGMTCKNNSGHGFTLSKNSQKLF